MLLVSHSASAGITVDKAIIEFDAGGEYYTDITVTNNETAKAYVGANIFEIENPGLKNEARKPLTDPDKALLIATPARTILEGKQSRPIRLLNLDEDQKQERVYRVMVEPVETRQKSDKHDVQVLVSYELLVIVRPEKPVVKVTSTRKGDTLTFTNAGNTSVFLESGQQCHPDKPKECKTYKGTRLYTGASWELKTDWKTPVTFTLNTGKENTTTQTF